MEYRSRPGPELEDLPPTRLTTTCPTPSFTPATLAFLRALKRNNDREWFKARKDRYERDVKAPMLRADRAAGDRLQDVRAGDRRVAEGLALYRIYRDTRFSPDKTPLKTNVAASFPWRGLHRHQGAGLYFEVAPTWVWIGGGMYAPEPPQLVKVREHIADTWPEIQNLTRAQGVQDADWGAGRCAADPCPTRLPGGFHPAAEILRHKQFLAGRELPAETATPRGLLPARSSRRSRPIVPLVRFLNEPLGWTHVDSRLADGTRDSGVKGFRVQGSRFRVQGSRFKVQG